MKASKLVIGAACLALSISVMADQSGGFEGMIDQMEKNGATHDLQMGMQSSEHSDSVGVQESDTPSENPITHVITPARPAVAAQPAATPTNGATASTHDTANTSAPRTASTASAPAPAEPVVAAAPPEPPRHNPLADQPRAAGGLEQIFNIMELNASTPLRPATPSAPPKPGIAEQASLSEQMAR
jgi:hypothetical protein